MVPVTFTSHYCFQRTGLYTYGLFQTDRRMLEEEMMEGVGEEEGETVEAVVQCLLHGKSDQDQGDQEKEEGSAGAPS